MGKTNLTSEIERKMCDYLFEKGKYPCLEVTADIGWSKDGRADIISADPNGIIRCYEIKITKSDFLSNNYRKQRYIKYIKQRRNISNNRKKYWNRLV